jgi:hypothetical protein
MASPRRTASFILLSAPFVIAIVASWIWVSIWLGVFLTVLWITIVARAVLRRPGRAATGRPCAYCERTIVVEHAAELCPMCHEPVHARCMDDHKPSHVRAPERAYR